MFYSKSHKVGTGALEIEGYMKRRFIRIEVEIPLDLNRLIVVIVETSSWELFLQSSGLQEEAVRVELTSYQWNTEWMWGVYYNVSGMSSPSRER